MGYSYSTPIKSERLRDEMFEFLEKNLTPLGDLFHDPYLNEYGPLLCTDPSYCHEGKWQIGFDYGSGGGDNYYYMQSILTFVAMRVGKRARLSTLIKRTRKMEDKPYDKASADLLPTTPVPFVCYDGVNWNPIVLTNSDLFDPLMAHKNAADKAGLEINWVDNTGWFPADRFWAGYKNPEYQKELMERYAVQERDVAAELKRLSKLWLVR